MKGTETLEENSQTKSITGNAAGSTASGKSESQDDNDPQKQEDQKTVG
jgi:hypothetical protein